MGTTLVTSVSTIAGVVIGALLGGWQQKANTKTLILSEFGKLSVQLHGENRVRIRARKEDWLLESVPNLIAAVDPELHAEFDYNRVVSLIHRIQVILDPKNPIEAAINNATTEIGLTIQAVKSRNAPRESLLNVQAALIEATREYLHMSPDQLLQSIPNPWRA